MALTNQPYLPLYIKDWLTNTKLKQCLLCAHGLMINIMCLMHKEETYGKLLLRQKFKQNDDQIKNFALMLAKLLPFDLHEIEKALSELIDEKVLVINDDLLICKRMVKDSEISATRALSGKKGGEKTKQKTDKIASDFAQAKPIANAEYENEYIKVTLTELGIYNGQKNYYTMVVVEMNNIWKRAKPEYPFMQEVDYPALLRIAYMIGQRKGLSEMQVVYTHESEIVKSFTKIANFLSTTQDKFFRKLTLDGIGIAKNFQKIEEAMRDSLVPPKNEVLESKRITDKEYFDKD